MDKEKNTEKNIDKKSKETSKRKYKRWLQSFINNDIGENLFGDLNKEFDKTPMHIKQSNIFANDEEALLIAQNMIKKLLLLCLRPTEKLIKFRIASFKANSSSL